MMANANNMDVPKPRQADIERAVKAARKQGMKDPAFTIGADGSITVFDNGSKLRSVAAPQESDWV